jgi:hypothetical protein
VIRFIGVVAERVVVVEGIDLGLVVLVLWVEQLVVDKEPDRRIGMLAVPEERELQ